MVQRNRNANRRWSAVAKGGAGGPHALKRNNSQLDVSERGGDDPAASRPGIYTTLLERPWIVPREQQLQLVFFRKVYIRLMALANDDGGKQHDDEGIPLILVQRSFSRLCRLLRDDRNFDARRYDLNGDGDAGWWEIIGMWDKEKLCMRLSPMERLYLTFEDPSSSRMAWLTSMAVFLTICVSAASFVASTMPSFQDPPPPTCYRCEPQAFAWFATVDTVCVGLFTMEYVTRLVTSAFMRIELTNEDELIDHMTKEETLKEPSPFQRMLSWATNWPNVIDLIAITPSYLVWTMEAATDGSGDSHSVRMMVVKVTRLMRVVRALRLGRRFEAVIIVVNTMKRSMRALWVLILNLALGMLVWGAVIYFLEQGEYSTTTGVYTRPSEDNTTTPFSSIPHSFWFALVTATTVGYGDVVPVTNGGRVVAGLNMVYSLCVLALPIGVIGSNFDVVWKDFDREKRDERDVKANAAWMLSDASFALDPLSYSKVLKLEVLHSPPLLGDGNDIFLGEAQADMQLDPVCTDTVYREVTLQLQEDRAKANRKATGEINVSYEWSPDTDISEPGTVLSGSLTINIISASDLGSIDWKASGKPDPRVRVTLYPVCSTEGSVQSQVELTPLVLDSSSPIWNYSFTAEVLWTRDGIIMKRNKEKTLHSSTGTLANPNGELGFSPMGGARKRRSPCDSPVSPVGKPGAARAAAEDGEGGLAELPPRLVKDVRALAEAVPALQAEINELKRDKDAVMAILGLEPSPVGAMPVPPEPAAADLAATATGLSSTLRSTALHRRGSPKSPAFSGASLGAGEAPTLLETGTGRLDNLTVVPGSVLDELYMWT